MPIEFPLPLLGFVAYSGSGKTTLLEKLIPELRRRGLRLALIKHAHHEFDIDTPGKDSYRLRKAGATQVMIASRKRWAMISEQGDDHPEPSLAELLPHIDCTAIDLLLVEGFKHEQYPKIEVWRAALEKPQLNPDDKAILALVCDQPPASKPAIPLLDMNDIHAVADFVIAWLAHHKAR